MTPPTDAEIERAREVVEEREYDAEYRGHEALPSIMSDFVRYPSKLLRAYAGSVLGLPALKRLHDIGHGVQTFDTPTAAGNVVQVEAPPVVQVAALKAILDIGVPKQLGLVDDQGNDLPGVIALGNIELDDARREVHGERYVSAETHARLVAAHHSAGPLAEQVMTPAASRPMQERIEAGEFEVVEIEEGMGVQQVVPEDRAPEPVSGLTPEQRILANRRARRNGERIPFPDEA